MEWTSPGSLEPLRSDTERRAVQRLERRAAAALQLLKGPRVQPADQLADALDEAVRARRKLMVSEKIATTGERGLDPVRASNRPSPKKRIC